MKRELSNITAEQILQPEPEGSVLLRGDFYRDFALEASRVKPGGEVCTMAMYIEPGEAANAVTNVFMSIPDAIRPLVGMHEYHDDYTRVIGPDNVINAVDALKPWRHEQVQNNRQQYEEMMNQFAKLGVVSHVLNPIDGYAQTIFPMTGRSHLKGSFVQNGDKSVYYIQTGNHESGPRDDVYIKIVGEPANKLITVFKDVVESGGPSEDTIYPISDEISVYYDSGKKGQSLILDTAKDLTGRAKRHVRNVSLFYPDGIREELQDATERAVDVRVIATKYYLEGGIVNINNMFYLIDKVAEASSLLHRDTFDVIRDPFNWAHAKLLIIDEDLAFVGSHNLSTSGVKAGTQEWQFLIKDRTIVNGLIRKFEDMAALAEDEKIKDLL